MAVLCKIQAQHHLANYLISALKPLMVPSALLNRTEVMIE